MRRGKPDRPSVLLEVLVEEESAYRLLDPALRRWLPADRVVVKVHRFQGRPDLLNKLPDRLSGYADARRRHHLDYRIAVLVDRDQDDCPDLKRRMEDAVRKAGLVSAAAAPPGHRFCVLTRIAVRELENWYFATGRPSALPSRACTEIRRRSSERGSDADGRKTSDAFERVLRRSGISLSSKPGWAERIAPHMNPDRNRSASFQSFISGIRRLVQQ